MGGFEGIAELGFAGLAAVLLFGFLQIISYIRV